jgi:hypothetical protein
MGRPLTRGRRNGGDEVPLIRLRSLSSVEALLTSDERELVPTVLDQRF